MITCDDVLTVLTEAGPQGLSAEQRAHLERCDDCRGAEAVLSLAPLPPPTEHELQDLEASTGTLRAAWAAWHPAKVISLASRRPALWRQVAQLAIAAGLGAVVASAVWLKHPLSAPASGQRTAVIESAAYADDPALPDQLSDEVNLSDDEVFFDVSWPTSATDGDL